MLFLACKLLKTVFFFSIFYRVAKLSYKHIIWSEVFPFSMAIKIANLTVNNPSHEYIHQVNDMALQLIIAMLIYSPCVKILLYMRGKNSNLISHFKDACLVLLNY